MEEKDINNGIDGVIDFIGMVWEKIFVPLVNGIGALFDTLPPVALGIIAGVLLLVWLFRKARHG